MLSTIIWADKNGLVSGRLACTASKKPEILNSILDFNPEFQFNLGSI